MHVPLYDTPIFFALIHSGYIKDTTREKYANGQGLKLQAKSGSAFLYFYSDKHYDENGFRIKYRFEPCSFGSRDLINVRFVEHFSMFCKEI